METKMKCRICGEVLHYTNLYTHRGLKGQGLRVCKDCGEQYVDKLKENFLIEIYKGLHIYKFEDLYYLNWTPYGADSCSDDINEIKEYVDFRKANPHLVNLKPFERYSIKK